MAVPEPLVHHHWRKCNRRDRFRWGIQEHILQGPDTDTYKDKGWIDGWEMGGVSNKEKRSTVVWKNAVQSERSNGVKAIGGQIPPPIAYLILK